MQPADFFYFCSISTVVFNRANNNEEVATEEIIEDRINLAFGDYSIELQDIAKKRFKYVKALERLPRQEQQEAITVQAKKMRDKTPPSLVNARRWVKKFIKSGRIINALIPNYAARGNKKERYCAEIVEIAIDALRNEYLDNHKTLEETLSAVRVAIRQANKERPSTNQLTMPKRKFLTLLLNDLDAYEVMSARYGKAYASRHFRSALHSDEDLYELLSRVEIDHTVLDLIVVDPKSLLPLGRPTITKALERRTRSILGFCISFEPPGYVQVMQCLKHAIMPKDYVKSKYPNIINPWECMGIPDGIVVDNGLEFHSKDLDAATFSLLIGIRYCPVKQPWWKGAIERYFKTMNQGLIHGLPGTTFSNPKEKKDYNSEKMAAIPLDVLEELMHIWICDVYHQTMHRSTLRSPASHWRELVSTVELRLPESATDLVVMVASVETRPIHHYGINLNNLKYNSTELVDLCRRLGKISVKIRWKRTDLGEIYVLDDTTNRYLRVPCTSYAYASGLSLWLHQVIRKDALSMFDDQSQASLDAAKARIRDICQRKMSSK